MMTEQEYPVRPCVGCGFCCKKAPCALGYTHFGHEIPCPALVEQGGRYWCKFVLETPVIYLAQLKDNLAIGAGCSSSLNSDRQAIIRKQREEQQR
jgi:hypothetical protein